MAPFLAMTSRHTFLRPSAQAAATRRACCERQMARTRALNAVFPKAGRPACRSSRSRWRSRFRSQAQHFSIGFKCGDLGGGRRRGMLHSKMPQGMFFILSLPWWVFPQPDFMVGRGGHRIALIFALFRMPHFKPALQRALLSFVPFAAACTP